MNVGEKIIKWLLFLIFAPTLFLVGLQVFLPIIAATLSVALMIVIIGAVIAGGIAGIIAILYLRRRLPPMNNIRPRHLPPHNVPPVRRPRGGLRREDW